MATQLPLNVELSDAYSFENYFPGPNKQLVTCLQTLLDDTENRFIYIWGGKGTGKTHLLQALCRYYSDRQAPVFYLPLKHKQDFSVSVFEGLENRLLTIIDDVEQVSNDAVWEEALFHHYNLIKDAQQGCLIISGNAAPNELGLSLADLSSRLGWGLVFQLKSMSDDDKMQALMARAHYRGLEMNSEVADYLLKRCPRDLPYIFSLLDKLDTASLAAKRKLTVPFIKGLI